MDRSFVSALERNLHCFVETLQAKNKLTNEIDIKCIKWGVTNSRMLDGKADGCSLWFLSRLAEEKPTARRVDYCSKSIDISTCIQKHPGMPGYKKKTQSTAHVFNLTFAFFSQL